MQHDKSEIVVRLKNEIQEVLSNTEIASSNESVQQESSKRIEIAFNQLFEIALELSESGKSNEADEIFSFQLEIFPDIPQIMFFRALNSYELNPKKSFELFSQLLNIHPDYTDAYYMILQICSKVKLHDSSLRLFGELISNNPNNMDLKYCKSVLLTFKNDFKEGLNLLLQVKENHNLLNNNRITEEMIDKLISTCKDGINKQDNFTKDFTKFMRERRKYGYKGDWWGSNDDLGWSCEICGGDETSGCLWNDPTECPR